MVYDSNPPTFSDLSKIQSLNSTSLTSSSGVFLSLGELRDASWLREAKLHDQEKASIYLQANC